MIIYSDASEILCITSHPPSALFMSHPLQPEKGGACWSRDRSSNSSAASPRWRNSPGEKLSLVTAVKVRSDASDGFYSLHLYSLHKLFFTSISPCSISFQLRRWQRSSFAPGWPASSDGSAQRSCPPPGRADRHLWFARKRSALSSAPDSETQTSFPRAPRAWFKGCLQFARG